jgi:hypothetical protein
MLSKRKVAKRFIKNGGCCGIPTHHPDYLMCYECPLMKECNEEQNSDVVSKKYLANTPKFKVGDKVRTKKSLINIQCYNNYFYWLYMAFPIGTITKIEENGAIKVDDSKYYYTEPMLKKIKE